MSRVDEAMRRAAEAAREMANGNQPPSPRQEIGAADGDAAEALAGEPFPMEIPERRNLAGSAPGRLPEGRDPLPEQTAEGGVSETIFQRVHPALSEKLVIHPNMSAASREQYRRIAAILHDAQATKALQVVMIASAVAGEGKTLTGANLALTLSGSYRKRVLLIDADLRRPALDRLFRLPAASGLSEGLDPASRARLIVRQISPNLAVLPAGQPTLDPMAALVSKRMQTLLEEARATFDWILIDTPPLVLLPDANLLASMVDGAVLVVKAGSTQHGLIARAVDAIGKPRIVGVVLNQTTPGAHDPYGYTEYYASAPSVALQAETTS